MSVEFITREHVAKIPNITNTQRKDLEDIADAFQVMIYTPGFSFEDYRREVWKEMEELRSLNKDK
jgi:hypothetical protein